jgi:hypothetical protein
VFRIRIQIQSAQWIRIQAKIGPQKEEKVTKFHVLSAGCSLLRAEGFSCRLAVLYASLGISKLQFLIHKVSKKMFSCKFFSIFGHQKHWIRIGIQLKMLDPDPDRDSMNPALK